MKTIAFIHAGMSFESYLGSYLYDEVYRGLRDACREYGLVCHSFDRRRDIARLIGRYDGYIGIIPSHSDRYAAWRLIGRRHPSVNIMMAPNGANLVATDDRAILTMLLDHLRAQGYTRIGYAGIARESYSFGRFRAYREYIATHAMPCEQRLVCGFSLRTGRANGPLPERPFTIRPSVGVDTRLHPFFASLIDAHPDAIIFETDYLALSFMTYAEGHGVRVPDDIAVAGIDDNRGLFPRYRNDMLTTAAQDFFGIGFAAASLLADIMSGERSGGEVFIAPALVVRRSTMRRGVSERKGDAAFRAAVTARVEDLYRERKPAARISRELRLNHRYFLAKFASIFGISFVDYLSEKRLERAALRLRETNEQVVSIAFSVGYTSHQHFGRAFKRRFRVSPAVYRRKNMTKSSVADMSKS